MQDNQVEVLAEEQLLKEEILAERAETPQENALINTLEIEEYAEVNGWSLAKKTKLINSLLFASSEPLPLSRILEVTRLENEELGSILKTLEEDQESSFDLVQVAGGYQLRTKPEFGAFIRVLKAERPRKLSAPALETLAIIAYRQPIVKSDIEKIRGVDCTPTLKTLMERDLIRIVGHQATVGQPALFATSEEFLKIFGLKSLADLPTLRDLTLFEKDPGE